MISILMYFVHFIIYFNILDIFKANNYAYAGDNAEARKKSATARRLVIASAIVGSALWILGFSFSIWPLLYAAGRGK
jgi:hypothetical protein